WVRPLSFPDQILRLSRKIWRVKLPDPLAERQCVKQNECEYQRHEYTVRPASGQNNLARSK
ncbi:hypothetical protein ACFL07_11060, partial [Pseudomonadota bacterium]